MAMAVLGSTALFSSSMCWITPSLSTTNVVRFENCFSWFRIPYSLETLRVMSLSRGNVRPSCFANSPFAAGLSMLIPKTCVSFVSILPVAIPAW